MPAALLFARGEGDNVALGVVLAVGVFDGVGDAEGDDDGRGTQKYW